MRWLGGGRKKLGWTVGWLAAFVWVLILAMIMFGQGNWMYGVVGMLIVGAAGATVFLCSPWRHPTTRYRVLLAPVYVLLVCAVAWGVWSLGDPRRIGFNSWWPLLLLFPVLLPLWTAGNRRWDDSHA